MCCYTYKRRTDVVGKEQDAIDLKDVLADGVALGPWGREEHQCSTSEATGTNDREGKRQGGVVDKEKGNLGFIWIRGANGTGIIYLNSDLFGEVQIRPYLNQDIQCTTPYPNLHTQNQIWKIFVHILSGTADTTHIRI